MCKLQTSINWHKTITDYKFYQEGLHKDFKVRQYDEIIETIGSKKDSQ